MNNHKIIEDYLSKSPLNNCAGFTENEIITFMKLARADERKRIEKEKFEYVKRVICQEHYQDKTFKYCLEMILARIESDKRDLELKNKE